ncbi:Erythrocyte band 7 integral membrane protein [Eumeta japonica]|uniref:Erythrocyte band 7 integral membrane protein n=1 Tax=Eumeta variegata TaxID=151549 RepID=A0A4C1ZDD1_EUMVA|nr:Erythrocyte band 7 integral membrane protein [Eumeta japonica]
MSHAFSRSQASECDVLFHPVVCVRPSSAEKPRPTEHTRRMPKLTLTQIIREYERAIVFRFGRLRRGARGPGLVVVLPCTDTCLKIDLRTVSFDVPPQEVLTKDSVTVAVDAAVYYRVKDPLNAVMKVADYWYLKPNEEVNLLNYFSFSTRLLAATTLRNVIGMRILSELLSEREAISHLMQSVLDLATDPWGVKVERVEIKDVRLPLQLQKAMAAEAEAVREARAKIVSAEGEIKASRALKEASQMMLDNPMVMQLRYLQSLNVISSDKNSTIVFPFPMDFFKIFMDGVLHDGTFYAYHYYDRYRPNILDIALMRGVSSENELHRDLPVAQSGSPPCTHGVSVPRQRKCNDIL